MDSLRKSCTENVDKLFPTEISLEIWDLQFGYVLESGSNVGRFTLYISHVVCDCRLGVYCGQNLKNFESLQEFNQLDMPEYEG